ncbi:J domain-containing protein, partial [Arenimonas malthae]|uniref:J domain-containing protein n=1 Tax=Arenimonas malthae TaxID=354197 RepID=UPI0005C1DD71
MAAAGHALELALACYRAPPRLAQAAQRPLPDDMLVLLRLAAGDEALAQECAGTAHESVGTVVDAAVFFIQQVLFAPGTDSYRALGVNPDAPDVRIKEHYRWLVRWLHPDRNPDEWDAIYADRVNRAWQDLRHPERRAAYDLSLADSANLAPVGAASAATPFARTVAAEAAPTKVAVAPPRVRISAEHPAAPLLSGRTAQRMPLIVLGTLGAVAGAALTLMWYAQTPRSAPAAASVEVVAVAEPSPVPEPVAALEPATAPEQAPIPAPAEAEAMPASLPEPRPAPVATPAAAPA